jgi:hypothetical protein
VSIKPWPDPKCQGPHKIGQRMTRWQHTKDCKDAFAERRKRGDEPTDSIPEDATIVERGRIVGAL